MNFDLQPNLENDLLILRPLKDDDFENLYKVASDPLIWEQHPANDRWQRNVFEIFFKEAIERKGAFALVDRKTGEIIGSSRFHPVEGLPNAIEIGWTFLARRYWGGHYNRSMKMLMMDYAYKHVDNIIFHIGENNMRSRKAVEKIGGELITHLEDQLLDPGSNGNVIYVITKSQFLSLNPKSHLN